MEEQVEDLIKQVVRETKELIKMLETTSVRRVSLEAGAFKIEVERAFAKGMIVPAVAASDKHEDTGRAKSTDHTVLAPLVGTYYHSASPGAKPFVELGARVQVGQTIGIIEVMKVMNAVTSDVAGVVVEILVQNGHPVQYEQPLMVIDMAAA